MLIYLKLYNKFLYFYTYTGRNRQKIHVFSVPNPLVSFTLVLFYPQGHWQYQKFFHFSAGGRFCGQGEGVGARQLSARDVLDFLTENPLKEV